MNYNFNETEFRGIDLNILLAFSALMRERSVTLAARRLLLGPSAVSMSLKRLRELFDDPLLIRGKEGLVPTPKAQELAAQVEQVLSNIHSIFFQNDAFDPTKVIRHFRFGAPDELEVSLVPILLKTLLEQAPGIRLSVRNINFRTTTAALDSGEVDLALTAKPLNLETWHTCHSLHNERFVCLYDSTQTGVKPGKNISLSKYLALPHLLQSPAGDLRGAIDERLDKLGRKRQVLMTASHFQTMPFVLKQTACLLNMPATGANQYAKAFGLTCSELPISSPTYEVALISHKRCDNDPALRWFRSIVVQIISDLLATARRKSYKA
jgi:LysR family transcriptional regulator, mexEF-oprN operon transcriptional activator